MSRLQCRAIVEITFLTYINHYNCFIHQTLMSCCVVTIVDIMATQRTFTPSV